MSLLLVAAVAMMVITATYSRLAGLLAGSLFALLHGPDGLAHAGERDFVVAVLLLVGCAFLFSALRGGWTFCLPAWGVCVGWATCVKPQVAVAGFAVSVLAAAVARRRGVPRLMLLSCTGGALPLAACLIFLMREQALGSFLTITRSLVLFHASLGRHSLSFLVSHAIPPQLLPLVLVAAAGLFVPTADERVFSRWEGAALLLLAAFGFASFVVQGKAYSYHRSSLIAFLLCLVMVQLVAMAGANIGATRIAAMLALAYAVLWLMPASTVRALRWDTREPTLSVLQADLSGLLQADPKLVDRGVQCLDTTAGCISVLDRMQLVQTTGFLYDCYIFAPGSSREIAEQRERFRLAILPSLPKVFVVTDQYCFGLPSSYKKLDQWQALKDLLTTRYTLLLDRPAAELPHRSLATWPFGYRIYKLRDN